MDVCVLRTKKRVLKNTIKKGRMRGGGIKNQAQPSVSLKK